MTVKTVAIIMTLFIITYFPVRLDINFASHFFLILSLPGLLIQNYTLELSMVVF